MKKISPNRVVASLLIVLLTGCGRSISSTPGSAPNLHAWFEEVQARPAPALDSLPVVQQFQSFEYAAQDKRDPFSDAWDDTEIAGLRPDANRRKQPLEGYPLDSLDMIGSIGQGPALVALIMAPDKVTHRVRVGEYLGQSDGRVTGVTESRIELIELVPDGSGGWLERPASITLENH
jgi:type IV pilus assembly protein PilP